MVAITAVRMLMIITYTLWEELFLLAPHGNVFLTMNHLNWQKQKSSVVLGDGEDKCN